MYLSDIILQSAHAGLALQSDRGDFPPGHNGPYYDKETPVRNTSHWLITMLKAYEISGKTIFKDSAYRAAKYLTGSEARPMNATFFCRLNPEKDFCNGLIGQAWALEALIFASKVFEDHRYKNLAKTVFAAHPFDSNTGLWRIVNTDGSYRSFDMTFNHQLWFAATGGMIDPKSDGAIGHLVIRFLDCAQINHLRVRRSGRIQHAITGPPHKNVILSLSRFFFKHSNSKAQKTEMVEKEIGYHAFNLCAFAILNEIFPDHPFWKTRKFFQYSTISTALSS